MAPEVIRGEPARTESDLYSLAVILWELLTGTRLYNADILSEADLLDAHLHAPIPTFPLNSRHVSRIMTRTFSKALAKDCENRLPLRHFFPSFSRAIKHLLVYEKSRSIMTIQSMRRGRLGKYLITLREIFKMPFFHIMARLTYLDKWLGSSSGTAAFYFVDNANREFLTVQNRQEETPPTT